MQFNSENSTSSRRKTFQTLRDLKINDVVHETSWDGKINLCMYNVPPQENISLNEFDEIAQERLTVLRIVEEVKRHYNFGSDEYNNALKLKLKPIFPIALEFPGLEKKDLARWRRRDVIGHFILRLAFCRNPEQTKWFINQEIDLFRYRLKHLNQQPMLQKEFLKANCINIDLVSAEELNEIELLLSKSFGTLEVCGNMQNYYKLPFTDAFDSIRRRKALLRGGMAYIHSESLTLTLCGLLRTQTMNTMTKAFKQLGMLEEENRILPRLSRLANNAYMGKIYEGNDKGEKISRYQLDQLCTSSYPPCMKQIHQRFRAEHHLRHGARRQYGLFLKAVGLSLEEAMAFMREEFTKRIDSDKFEKQYAYNVRHMYGKEGKRVGYPSLPCSTIILTNPPAAGDCHGCPFKHTDSVILGQRLTKENLNKDQVNQIIELTKVSAYDKACTRFFEYSHKMEDGALGQLITHPNQFYELSREIITGTRTRETHIHVSQSQVVEDKTLLTNSKTSSSHGAKPSFWNPMAVAPKKDAEMPSNNGSIDNDDF